MMELTKERLERVINLDDIYDPELTKAMARQLLASMEQEPVAWLLSGGGAKNHVSFDIGNAYADPLREVTPLYAAPQLPQPAPVAVPDEMEMDDDFDSAFEHGKAVGWNACRAAMLNHSEQSLDMVDHIGEATEKVEPVSQPYTLRDGWVAVPVEPTESMIIAGFEAELREEFRDPEAWEAFEAMSGCEQAAHRAKLCWAAMIAVAPQQEV